MEVSEEGVNAAAAVSQSVKWFGEEASTKGVDVCGSFQGRCFCVCSLVMCMCVLVCVWGGLCLSGAVWDLGGG